MIFQQGFQSYRPQCPKTCPRPLQTLILEDEKDFSYHPLVLMDDDDPPQVRYALRDDDPYHRVCFASLLMVAIDYDTPDERVEYQNDHGPNNDHLQGRNLRRWQHEQRNPNVTGAVVWQAPQAVPMWGLNQHPTATIQNLPPVPLPQMPPPVPPPHPHPCNTTPNATILMTGNDTIETPVTGATTTTVAMITASVAATQLETTHAQQGNTPVNTTDLPTPVTPAPATHVTLTTYNVVSARGTRLLMALRSMADLNTDIAILTETKLCGNRYAKQGFGYSVFATSATSPHKGGIALVWRTKPAHWILEGMRILSPNSISAMLVSGT